MIKAFEAIVLLLLPTLGMAQFFGNEIEISESVIGLKQMTISDVDGDGDNDIIIGFGGFGVDSKICWYENDGSGDFSQLQTVSEGYNCSKALLTYDLDTDGDIDIIAASNSSDDIVWYENDGEGNFSDQQFLAGGNSGNGGDLHTADINGDQAVDLVFSSPIDGHIVWLENDGNNDFTEQQVITNDFTGVPSRGTSAVYDIDNDGDVDVLFIASNSTIVYCLNNGEGAFDQELLVSDSLYAAGLFIEDINLDGDMDVVSFNLYNIYFNENNSDGTFGDPELVGSNFRFSNSIAISDVDGDAYPDIIQYSANEGVVVQRNNGLGGFESSVVLSDWHVYDSEEWTEGDYEESYWKVWLNTEDINNDGQVDFITGVSGENEVEWHENLGDEGFSSSKEITQSVTDPRICISDLNGDSYTDIIVISHDSHKLGWYQNLGNGSFDELEIILSNVHKGEVVCTSDADNDGDEDIFLNFERNKFKWLENDGVGGFVNEHIIYEGPNLEVGTEGPRLIHLSDMDGDGDKDLLITREYTSYWERLEYFQNDGNGNFSNEESISFEFYVWVTAIDTDDLDGDGEKDIVVSVSTQGWNYPVAYWFKNLGNGNFSSEQIVAPDAFASSAFVSSVDLDSDGDIDIVCDSHDPSSSRWFENDGTGEFQSHIVGLVGLSSVVDIDNDGDYDVLTNENLYLNNGVGNFEEPMPYLDEVNYGKKRPLKVNSDNYIDLVMGRNRVYWLENLTFTAGCTDDEACNFNPLFLEDDGSCCYGVCGCTNPLSDNYSDNIDCEVECQFTISGQVFNDENQNGVIDESEYGLPYQTIIIQPQGTTIITNDQGFYSVSIEQGTYIQNESDDSFPFYSTPSDFEFDPEQSESTIFNFGRTNEAENFEFEVGIYPAGNAFLCDEFITYDIHYRNIGNAPVYGTLRVDYDDLFQGVQEIFPIDSIVGNSAFMSFENLLPGEMFVSSIRLLTPSADFIGQDIVVSTEVIGLYNDEQVAFGEFELIDLVTCSYDPNDKQAFPLGYTDEHWILPETQQEFLVRFQNTGNAPAQNVRIIDTLDINWDLNTFQIIANSHSVMTTIDASSRTVDFFFEDIQLLDSLNNESESHGLVSYKIGPKSNLDAGTELNNTAYIYFDNNEPIITNTTWTTIHNCGGESDFETSDSDICTGGTIDFISIYEHIEEYEWTIESIESQSFESTYSEVFDFPGEYEVILNTANPLCEEFSSIEVSVHEVPEAVITVSGDMLSSSEGDYYQWNLDGMQIEGANDQILYIQEDGSYSVEVINGGVCNSESEEVFVVDISENETEYLTLYPNPMATTSILQFEKPGLKTVELYNSIGIRIKVWNSIVDQQLELQKSNLSSGNYFLKITEGETNQFISLIIK